MKRGQNIHEKWTFLTSKVDKRYIKGGQKVHEKWTECTCKNESFPQVYASFPHNCMNSQKIADFRKRKAAPSNPKNSLDVHFVPFKPLEIPFLAMYILSSLTSFSKYLSLHRQAVTKCPPLAQTLTLQGLTALPPAPSDPPNPISKSPSLSKKGDKIYITKNSNLLTI